MRRAQTAALALLAALATPRPALGTVFAWYAGGSLHLANDAEVVPQGTSVRRFTARQPPLSAPPPATAQQAPPPRNTDGRRRRAPVPPPAVVQVAPTHGPIIVAPTIVVRTAGPLVLVAPPPAAVPRYLPTGFVGHRHPQVPFLRGRRLVAHSHFHPRGGEGLFMPYGHVTHHGILRANVAASEPGWY